jgi:hypothetical protein
LTSPQIGIEVRQRSVDWDIQFAYCPGTGSEGEKRSKRLYFTAVQGRSREWVDSAGS